MNIALEACILRLNSSCMKATLAPCLTLLLTMASLSSAQTTADTWVLVDGKMFEAQVRQVVPGKVTFALRNGSEQAVDIAQLSQRSRTRLAQVLGLDVAAAPVPVVAGKPAPTTPAAGARDPAALDATDAAALDINEGKTVVVIGKVTDVKTLGDTGHKLVEFDNADFYIFISKTTQGKFPDWTPDVFKGKTLQVRGTLARYRDKPQIVGSSPDQFTVVE